LTLFSRPAQCAEERVPSLPHRVGGAIGDGPGAVHIGHYASEQLRLSGNAFSLHATYGYQLVEGLEVGASLNYWNSSELNGFVTALRMRPYVPLGDRVEIGLPMSAGLLMWPHAEGSEELWLGPSFSMGIDCTIWVSRAFGLELFFQGATGNVSGASLQAASTGFLAAGGGLGFLGRL
jgi:hypothetical protein